MEWDLEMNPAGLARMRINLRRSTAQQKCGAAPRRARIQGSQIVVSLNSRLESNQEEEEDLRVCGVGPPSASSWTCPNADRRRTGRCASTPPPPPPAPPGNQRYM